VESTPGTQVSGNRKLTSLDVQWSPNVIHQEFRAAGRKYPGASVVHGIDAKGTWNCIADFNALVYPFSGYVGGVITTPGGGTLSRNWAFTPVMVGRDTNQKTFTAERGDAVAAQVVTFLQFNSITCRWQRTPTSADLSFNGDVFARSATDGQTLTSSPTTIAQSVASAPQIRIYIDTTYGGIGTTPVTAAYEGGFSLGAKFSPFYAFDNTSTFQDTAELAPPVTFNFHTAHNAQSRAFFANINSNATYFTRFEVIGPILEGSIHAKFVLDIAGRYIAAAEEDASGVYGYNYTLQALEDSTFNTTGGIWLANIVNLLTSL
jgi:hypothetical protein